ncbi:MAG: hypothetical protein EOO40_05520 [Deltaproteobacteria bacterium]|nr:MAG: hypothetical protein EOO40_05520 [Deltaproteobacteria bacterium]
MPTDSMASSGAPVGQMLPVRPRDQNKGVYVAKPCRRHLDDYLAAERRRDDTVGVKAELFLPVRAGDCSFGGWSPRPSLPLPMSRLNT